MERKLLGKILSRFIPVVFLAMLSVMNLMQVCKTPWGLLVGFSLILAAMAALITFIVRCCLRRNASSELEEIRQTVQKVIAGDEDAMFQESQDARLKPVVDALNEWSRGLGGMRERLNLSTCSLGPNTAAFEYRNSVNRVYHSDNLQSVLGADDGQWCAIQDDAAAFSAYMAGLAAEQNEDGVVLVNGKSLCVKLYQMDQDYFGVVADKTEEIRRQAERARLYLNALNASETDELTGLLNRRGFASRAGQILTNGADSLVMLMIDADNFKQINDTMGHPTGDSAMQCLAQSLKGQFRESDLVARLGGDEFAVLMRPSIPEDMLKSKLDKVLENVRESMSEAYGEHSITIGAVRLAYKTASYEELYQCADKALYSAKHLGKNTYVIHTY